LIAVTQLSSHRSRSKPAFRGIPISEAVSVDGSSFDVRGSLVIVRDAFRGMTSFDVRDDGRGEFG
jgi:hypothetical protein